MPRLKTEETKSDTPTRKYTRKATAPKSVPTVEKAAKQESLSMSVKGPAGEVVLKFDSVQALEKARTQIVARVARGQSVPNIQAEDGRYDFAAGLVVFTPKS